MEPTTDGKNSAGELLRQGRLRQRLSMAECAKRTHIAVRYIEALEEEQWSVLPSESHRLGFLRLYARFLGVSAEEVIARYRNKATPGPDPHAATGSVLPSGRRILAQAMGSPRWSPTSIPQLIGMAILVLISAWLIYHAVIPHFVEQNITPWSRRSNTRQARLVVPKAAVTGHRVRIKAQADSWLRVTSRGQLLFEGILPAGSSKEWSGAGPFQFKMSNVRAVSLFWNDQPVDVLAGAHGTINDLRIPPQ